MRKASTQQQQQQQAGGVARQALQTPPWTSIRPYLTTVTTDLSALSIRGAKKHARCRMPGNGLDVLGKLSGTLVSKPKAVLKSSSDKVK